MTAMLRLLRVPAMMALLVLIGLGIGFVLFVTRLPRTVEDVTTKTDAIVVLTGGSDRIATGMKLLRSGMARSILISGVPQEVTVQDLAARVPDAADWSTCCVTLGRRALDTMGNAEETRNWMRERQFRSLRLVTAHYHMPRSQRLFAHAMPDVAIVAHPVFPQSVRAERWWRWPGTTRLLTEEYAKYLAALAWTIFFPAGTG